MTIETRDFGTLQLDEDALLEFRAPVYGFEELTRYVLLSDDEAGPGIMWLQALDRPDVCFVLLDPAEMGVEYAPEVTREVADLLELSGEPVVRLITVVPEDFHDTTVNLKSPILINREKKLAAQVILDADYPIRMRLFGGEGK